MQMRKLQPAGSFGMTLFGLSLGFALLKVQGEKII
jgi:hypothetical protein